jgi:hypothetical protein
VTVTQPTPMAITAQPGNLGVTKPNIVANSGPNTPAAASPPDSVLSQPAVSLTCSLSTSFAVLFGAAHSHPRRRKYHSGSAAETTIRPSAIG